MPTLLQRQIDLLEHLTSGGVIYGDEADGLRDQAPPGIDRGLLRLEAVFSHEKRMFKITAAFPRTFKLLGSKQTSIVRDFTTTCPPIGISRVENARQFFDYLSALWRRVPPEPEHLPDVAGCELACAQARAGDDAGQPERTQRDHPGIPSIRRHPHVILQRCSYDIRPIFEGDETEARVARRDTRLAITVPPDAEHPKVLELLPVVFDLLTALDDWSDHREFGVSPELDELIGDLVQHGLVEARS